MIASSATNLAADGLSSYKIDAYTPEEIAKRVDAVPMCALPARDGSNYKKKHAIETDLSTNAQALQARSPFQSTQKLSYNIPWEISKPGKGKTVL